MSAWVRRAHRWLSGAFTLAGVANVVANLRQQQATWLGILALVPLALLLCSGLYLLALPHVARLRGRREEAA